MNAILCAMLAAAGCSGVGNADSGVPGADLLVSLDAAQQQDVCAYAQSIEGGARTVMCGSGSSITAGISTTDACAAALAAQAAASPDCTATVTDDMLCIEATANESDDQLCAGFVPDDCAAIAACP